MMWKLMDDEFSSVSLVRRELTFGNLSMTSGKFSKWARTCGNSEGQDPDLLPKRTSTLSTMSSNSLRLLLTRGRRWSDKSLGRWRPLSTMFHESTFVTQRLVQYVTVLTLLFQESSS